MSKSFLPTPRYRIIAIDKDGEEFECFTWDRSPEAGIERAKAEAPKFGFHAFTDFRAVRIEG